jgi:protein SCO1/2
MQKKDIAANGWHFFVSDSASIIKATNAVGFKYKKTGNDFLHAASLCVVSPRGKITRYLNGMYFLPFEWKMAILEASEGKSGPTVNKILKYCFSYDPAGQRYVMSITRVGGVFILFFALILLIVLILKPKRKKA